MTEGSSRRSSWERFWAFVREVWKRAVTTELAAEMVAVALRSAAAALAVVAVNRVAKAA